MWLLALLACGTPPETVETAHPTLTPGRTLVDFGQVFAHTTATQWLKLENTGDAPLTLGAPTFLGGSAYFGASDIAGTVVPPGESRGVELTFDAPDESLPLSTVLSIPSDDPDGDVWIDVTGTPLPSSIYVSPTMHAFGDVGVGCDPSRTSTVRNTGATPITITSLAVGGAFVATADPALPWTLQPDQTSAFEVTFTPTEVGPFEATVDVVSDHGTVAQQYLSGAGADRASYTETFTVDGGAVDVIIPVQMPVDGGGAFATDTEPFVENFPDFLDRLDKLGVEYQIAVIVPQDGCSAANKPFLDWKMDRDTQMDIVEDSLNDPGWQHGLMVAMEAVSDLNTGPSGCNEGLLRDEARLAILGYTYVGENHPDAGWMMPVNKVLDAKDDEDDVTFYGIVEDLVGARGSFCGAGSHSFWSDAVDYTGGEWYRICDEVEEGFAGIADLLAGAQTVFPLAHPADASTISVTIDGTATTEWSYRTRDNSVELTGAAVGKEVVIAYDGELACPE